MANRLAPSRIARPRPRSAVVALLRCQEGTVAIETAFCLPPMLMVMSGIVSFGSWFMAAHGVQQAADEGARAAIAGLTDAERSSLALASVGTSLAANPQISPNFVTSTAVRNGSYFTVTISYAVGSSGWARIGPMPMPTSVITRSATIRLNAS